LDRSKSLSVINGKSKNPQNPLAGKSALKSNGNRKLLFSFKDFDSNQGQSFIEWEKEKLLADLMIKMYEYSNRTIQTAFDGRFKIYGNFPKKTRFKYPPHVTSDANWASMHIKGQPCIAGHIVENIFYIVFLDKEHHFYYCDLQSRNK
jgi:hypothetical protein